jgi:hypothetical protein
MAAATTAAHGCPDAAWSLDGLAERLVNAHAEEAMSRSTVWRALQAADLKPHRCVYWLNSHDPDFGERARAIGQLYVDSPHLYQEGHLVICTDEKCGMQILQRAHPTQEARPGRPRRREHEYVRHGTRALFASFVTATGEVVWDLGPTRTSEDFAAHLLHTARRFLAWPRITWVVDNLNTHWSLAACEILALLNERDYDPKKLRHGRQRKAFVTDPTLRYRFEFTPRHGSWLNQVELFFSVLARQFLRLGDFAGGAQFERRLGKYLRQYNREEAHPYRWTYTGEPLVRETPFSRTRAQARHGRAWTNGRPRYWQRLLYPPRPYHRSSA